MWPSEAGISFSDWVSCFSWDPMQAAREIQRVLDTWARRLADRSVPYLRLWSAQSGRATAHPPVRPRSLRFWDFHGVLIGMGVSWLTLKQQRLLFQSLDSNRNGRVDLDELQHFQAKRLEIELRREASMAEAVLEPLEETQAAESEDSAAIDAIPELQREGEGGEALYEESEASPAAPLSPLSPNSPGYSESWSRQTSEFEPVALKEPKAEEPGDTAKNELKPEIHTPGPAGSLETKRSPDSDASYGLSQSDSESPESLHSVQSPQSPGYPDSFNDSED